MTTASMSPYEARRWRELESHWAKKAQRRPLTPPNVRAAAATASAKAKDVAVRTGTAIAGSTPEPVKDFGGWFADAALAPTVDGIVRTIELVNDWASELADPEKVLGFHRKKGRRQLPGRPAGSRPG